VRASGRLAIPLLLSLIALLPWVSSGSAPATELAASDVEGRCGEGWLEDENGVRILHLGGTPYEMGYQQGVLLRSEIRDEIRRSVYGSRIQERQVSHLFLLRLAREIDGRLSCEYREELAGLAEGAGVSYVQVLLLNTCEDAAVQPWPAESTQDLMLTLSPVYLPHLLPPQAFSDSQGIRDEEAAGAVSETVVDGAFSVFGAATVDAGLLQVAEFRSPLPSTDELVVVHYQPHTGNSFVTVRRPGVIGLSLGLNEERVAVTALPSPSQDASLEGMPLPFLLREVLQYAGDIPAALGILASAERDTGHNVLVADGKRPDGKVVECSAHQYAVFDAEGDLVVRTSHYVDAALRETQYGFTWWNEDASWEKLEALLRELESDYGSLDASRAVRLVQRLGESGQGGCTEGDQDSVLGVLMDVSELTIRLVTCDGSVSSGPGLDLDQER
jgi:isopenicillin-N N-acyltransferase-like protein